MNAVNNTPKHTPGVWSIEKLPAPIYGSNGTLQAEGVGIGTASEHIATVIGREATRGPNAALIAAAPAMYAALLQYAKIHDILSDIIEDGNKLTVGDGSDAIPSRQYQQLVNLLASTNINAVLELVTKEAGGTTHETKH